MALPTSGRRKGLNSRAQRSGGRRGLNAAAPPRGGAGRGEGGARGEEVRFGGGRVIWSWAQRVARVTARASAAILPAPVSRGGRGGVQAGNVCVATGHLLRSVSAARSGCVREARGGSRAASSEPRLRVAFRSIRGTVKAPGCWRASCGALGRPAAAWHRPPCGRSGSAEPRPRLPSDSARCLDRGSHDQIPGLPGITTR